MDGSYSVAHRAGLLPTEPTGMWGWILLRSPHRGRVSRPAPTPTKKGLAPSPPGHVGQLRGPVTVEIRAVKCPQTPDNPRQLGLQCCPVGLFVGTVHRSRTAGLRRSCLGGLRAIARTTLSLDLNQEYPARGHSNSQWRNDEGWEGQTAERWLAHTIS